MNGLVTLDLDGRVVTVNLAAETLTGCAASVLTGRPATEVFHHVPELRDLLLETLRTRVGIPQVVLMLPRGEGPSVPVEVATTPLRGAEGQALGVVAILRDLTPVRQLEEQLRRSDRLAALGTLAAGLAHEIKNPLTSIMTFSRHVARRFDDERFRQRFQSVVPRELERINAIVDGLLRLARPARLVLAPVHLPPLVEQALELYAPQIEARGIRVRREWSVSVPPVPGDAEHLYQAILNLVANAIDAMEEEGGTLTVRLGWPQTAEGLGAVFRDRLVLEVMDTGSGIKPEETADSLQPVLHHEVGGHGARACHRAQDRRGARRHGDVPQHPRPGDGVHGCAPDPGRAPRRPSGLRRGADRESGAVSAPTDLGRIEPAPEALPPRAEQRGARALLVEDERVVGELLAEFLALEGYEVDRAMNGREALDLVRRRAYTLIVSDVRMPDVDGPALYHELRVVRPEVVRRMVFVTGDIMSTATRRFLDETCLRYLEKPFTIAEFQAVVQGVLAEPSNAGPRQPGTVPP